MAISNRALRNLRNLGHQKSPRMVIGHGIPNNRDGNEGEFRLHSTANGIRLYVKYARKWIGFAPETETEDIIQLDDSGALVEEGSITLPSGLIIQWGKAETSADPTTVTFPLEFPHKCVTVYLTGQIASDSGGSTSDHIMTGTPSTTSFTISAYTTLDAVYWLALGN